MELYIKESRDDYMEVIDLQHPEYCFVFENIKFVSDDAGLLLECKESVRKINPLDGKYNDTDEDLGFLSGHAEAILKELAKAVVL